MTDLMHAIAYDCEANRVSRERRRERERRWTDRCVSLPHGDDDHVCTAACRELAPVDMTALPPTYMDPAELEQLIRSINERPVRDDV